MNHETPGRLGVALGLLSLVLCVTSGCSLFDFGRHDSFDAWYVGPEDAFDPESIGWRSLDGEFSGYVVNDMLIRTPAMLVYETTRAALVPVAASCFACRCLFGSDEDSAAVSGSGEGSPGASETADPDSAPATESSAADAAEEPA